MRAIEYSKTGDPDALVGQRPWAYAHVPHGYTAAVIGQIERFAKGFRDQIVATATRNAPEIAAYNANYIGGDLSSGANTAKQIAVCPRFALNPYTLGVKGL